MLHHLETIARECGEAVLSVRTKKGLQTHDKDDTRGAHYFTQADTESQRIAIEKLQVLFPQEAIIAEEQENNPTIPPDCTVIDPIDGTIPYFNGYNEFGVTLCTLRNSQPHYGVMYFPVDNTMISAERGRGWFLNGKKQPRIKWNRPVDKTVLSTDIGPWYARETLDSLASEGFTFRSILCAIWEERDILLGHTGGYYNLGVAKIWDIAAGALAIQEAGGVVYNPWGKPLTWNTISMDWVAAPTEKLAQRIIRHTERRKGRSR